MVAMQHDDDRHRQWARGPLELGRHFEDTIIESPAKRLLLVLLVCWSVCMVIVFYSIVLNRLCVIRRQGPIYRSTMSVSAACPKLHRNATAIVNGCWDRWLNINNSCNALTGTYLHSINETHTATRLYTWMWCRTYTWRECIWCWWQRVQHNPGRMQWQQSTASFRWMLLIHHMHTTLPCCIFGCLSFSTAACNMFCT